MKYLNLYSQKTLILLNIKKYVKKLYFMIIKNVFLSLKNTKKK